MDDIDMLYSIDAIIKCQYVIPLYQRNFAWRELEIKQLILDLYQSYQRQQGSYFIGSLVVIKRGNCKEVDQWEVIDGQQRLTVLSLILKFLNPDYDRLRSPFLTYDSRDAVNDFFSQFHKADSIKAEDKWLSDITDLSVKDYVAAVYYIHTAPLNSIGEQKLLGTLSDSEKKDFAKYILDKVFMVFVEMPQETDVANYFEIMNNRGAQLQSHEVLKSLLMGKISGDLKNQDVFSQIWDACSDMDHMVQKNSISRA